MDTHPPPAGSIFAPDAPGAPGDLAATAKAKAPGSGAIVFARYKLDRILGRGGMGVVWLAEDLKLERPVALKFLPSLVGIDPAAVKELKIETRRGLELSHPNIVRIYDFVDDEEAAAISMEFVDGKTLSELRMSTEFGVFSVAEISEWLPGVCEALDYAHFHRQLVHRDLKPANIMVNTHRVAKIADFGIARSLADTMSRLSAFHLGGSGTLPYMSPQQAMGERPLPTDDVYSLAATLYEMLGGKPPFYRGDLPTQITSKIPPSIQERRTELEIPAKDPIPHDWERAIAKALHKDAAMRPASAGSFAEMLGLKMPGLSTRTFTFGTQPAPPPVKPAKLDGKGFLAIAAAFVVTAVIIWWAAVERQGRLTAGPPAEAPAAPAAAEPGATSPAGPGTPQPSLTTEPPAAQVAAFPNPLTLDTVAPPALAPLLPLPMDPLAINAAPGPSPLERPLSTTLPSGPVTVDSPEASGAAPAAPPTMIVEAPPEGFWEVEDMFPDEPFAAYSLNGKRYVLHRVQNALKKEGLYTASLDGKAGKETYKAILAYQVSKGLLASGLLDLETLAAMDLMSEPDKATWSPPAEYTRRYRAPEKPGLMDRVRKLFR